MDKKIILPPALSLEYYVSPTYKRRYLKTSQEWERGDGMRGVTHYYEDNPSTDQFIEWLEQNSLAEVKGAYHGSSHSDSTFLFSGDRGIIAGDTHYTSGFVDWNLPIDKEHQRFIRVRSPQSMGIIPEVLTQTFQILGYEKQEPTDDFKKKCPQFFK